MELDKSTGCPDEAVYYETDGVCYWVEAHPQDFAGANTQCGIKGGILAKIRDADALQFIQEKMSTQLR